MHRATRIPKGTSATAKRMPHDASQLFIWQTPFRPVVTLPMEPHAGAAWRGAAAEQAAGRQHTIFLSMNLLGDLLCTTPVVQAFRQRHPDHFLTYVVHNAPYCRVLDGNPDLDMVLYRDDLHLHGEQIVTEAWCRTLPLGPGAGSTVYRFNVHEVCRSDPHVFEDQIAAGFSRFVGIPISSVRPVVQLQDGERRVARRYTPRPYVVFGMHSSARVVGSDQQLHRKDWVTERWLHLAREVRARWGFDVIAVGAEGGAVTRSRHVRSLYGLPIKVVAALLADAECVIAVEGGLTHLGHAVDAAMVVLFSPRIAFEWAHPRGATRCRILRDDPRAITTMTVLAAVTSLLHPRWTDST